jgi:hypothetical protein
MNLDSVRLLLELTSPDQETDTDSPAGDNEAEYAAPAPGEVEEEADPFPRATDAVFSSDWFAQNLGDPWGFQLVIDAQRSRELSAESFDGILDYIAEDLHDLGAETSQPCSECNRPATTLGYFDTLEGSVLARAVSSRSMRRKSHCEAGPFSPRGPWWVRLFGDFRNTQNWGYRSLFFCWDVRQRGSRWRWQQRCLPRVRTWVCGWV